MRHSCLKSVQSKTTAISIPNLLINGCGTFETELTVSIPQQKVQQLLNSQHHSIFDMAKKPVYHLAIAS